TIHGQHEGIGGADSLVFALPLLGHLQVTAEFANLIALEEHGPTDLGAFRQRRRARDAADVRTLPGEAPVESIRSLGRRAFDELPLTGDVGQIRANLLGPRERLVS